MYAIVVCTIENTQVQTFTHLLQEGCYANAMTRPVLPCVSDGRYVQRKRPMRPEREREREREKPA